MKSKLFKRIISGLVLAGFIIPVIIFSGETLILILAFISLFALWEFTGLTDMPKLYRILALVWGGVIWASVMTGFKPMSFAVLTIPVIGIVVLFDKNAATTGMKVMSDWLLGIVYCVAPFLLCYFILFDGEHPYDWRMPLAIVLINYMSDTTAYLAGKYTGKRLFSPNISPRKTWEGAIGGFIGAWIMGIAVYLLAGEMRWNLLIITAIISIFNQPGDLIESVIKRGVNKKDSGNIIPGHGGILDRIDSLLTIFPIIYFYQSFI